MVRLSQKIFVGQLFCLLMCLLLQQTLSASFYGASYVSYAFQEAKSTTEINLRFKTHQADAILLLAAGRTDYCLLVLEAAGLKVRINLGAGEAELTSPPGLRLNDLMWHDVNLERTNADMLLVVDTIHRTRLTIPGRFHELNIHFGVYVGGLGDFNELFLGNMDNFRGCLDNLTLNSINVFRSARENLEQRGVH
uniref:Laminin G domain-containing protein n=1 Tax=Strigamia maritima TaxID=126957 RepID=T1IWI3_STRMM